MITIQLVRNASGTLVGRRFCDRWNLEVLRKDLGRDIGRRLTPGQVAHFRRVMKVEGFTLAIGKGEMVGIDAAELGAVRPLQAPNQARRAG